MRTKLLCAVAVLCGAGVSRAQMGPLYNYNAYNQQGYGAGYQMPAGYYGNNGYPQTMRQVGYMPYNQGYAGYPNGYYYGNNAARYQNYSYPTNYPQPAVMPPTGEKIAPPEGAGKESAAPTPPVVSERPGFVIPDPVAACPVPVAVPAKAPEKDKERGWVGAEYQFSYIQTQKLPAPLLTIGSTQAAFPGAVGQVGTVAVFDDSINFGMFSGMRAEAGFWLDDSGCYSLELSGNYAFENSVRSGRTSDANGNPIIARPFFDIINGNEDGFRSSLPFAFAGSTSIVAKSEFWGAEIEAAYHWRPSDRFHVDGLFGARYVHLNESLVIDDMAAPINGNVLFFQGNLVAAPSSLADQDSFRTSNSFYGLQIGGRAGWEQNWFSVTGYGKIAMGATDQSIDINGSSTLFSQAGNQVATGGLLALPSNIGHYTKNVFGFVPELGLTVGVIVTPHIQLTAGYSMLYWDQVVRPGGQIDRNVNLNNVPTTNGVGLVPGFNPGAGVNRPTAFLNEESVWIQNINLGLGIHY